MTWDEESGSYILNAETPGWQMIETRDCVIMQTEDYGLVALLPIGMSQVSSVNFEDTVKVGATVKKGDALGYFLFGGSDFVIIFQRRSKLPDHRSVRARRDLRPHFYGSGVRDPGAGTILSVKGAQSRPDLEGPCFSQRIIMIIPPFPPK